MSVVCRHQAGFFACCNLKLEYIITFINHTSNLPYLVDSSGTFSLYKKNKDQDVTYDFFKHYDRINISNELRLPINYSHKFQFIDYSSLDFSGVSPILKKYFTPSDKILNNHYFLLYKYNINPDNCIGLYYRGTDKYTETEIGSFETFECRIVEILIFNPNLKIILVTDSTKCLEYFKNKFPSNLIVITENRTSSTDKGIHNESTSLQNYEDMVNLFSIFLILSKCRYLICSSGNCSIFMVLYRGSGKNVCQYHNGTWYRNINY